MPTIAPVAEPLGPLVRQHALAAADVEQRLRVGLGEQLVERALERGHEPPHDGVRGAVLVVGVAGDRALGIDGHGGGGRAHSRNASRSSVLPVAPPASAPVVFAWPVGLRAGLVVRRLDAELQLDAPHALERALGDRALRGEQVAHDAERREHHRRVEEHRAEDERLDVALALVLEDVEVGEARPHDDRDRADEQRRAHEDLQRLVLRVDAEDRDAVAPHVGPHRRKQPRLARLGVRPDRDVVDRDEQLARLDDRLERVRELRDDDELDRGLAVVGAKAGGRVGDLGRRGLAHDPRAELLQHLLQRREVLDVVDLAVADDHVGAALHDRRDELGDVVAGVLVVAVGVDDDVGAELQARVEAGLEARREALVVRQPDDVVDAAGARDLDRPVARPVVDDQPFDRVESVDLPREVGKDEREGLLLVEAGDLDDQLHAAGRHGILTAIASSPVSSASSAAAVVSPPPAEAPVARRRTAALTTPVMERVGLGVLVLAAVVFFVVYPTYPNYDSYYSLLWGRELLDLDPLSFEAYRAPTEHPLAIAFGALLVPLGDIADRVMVGFAVLSFIVLVAGLYVARQDRLHAARRVRRGRAARDALRLPVPRGPRLHRHPVPRGRHLGGGDRGSRAAPTTGRRAAAARRRRAHAPGGVAARRPVLAVARAAGELGAARALRAARRDRPARLGGGRLRRDRPAAVLADRDGRPRRRARAQQGRRGRARGALRVSHQARRSSRSSSAARSASRWRSC